jgi:hypothetical protein
MFLYALGNVPDRSVHTKPPHNRHITTYNAGQSIVKHSHNSSPTLFDHILIFTSIFIFIDVYSAIRYNILYMIQMYILL